MDLTAGVAGVVAATVGAGVADGLDVAVVASPGVGLEVAEAFAVVGLFVTGWEVVGIEFGFAGVTAAADGAGVA